MKAKEMLQDEIEALYDSMVFGSAALKVEGLEATMQLGPNGLDVMLDVVPDGDPVTPRS
jgi:hypothetical protein